MTSACVPREARKKTPAAARLAAGRNWRAPTRPTRSASQPVTIGPGAKPKTLLASVRTAKAVPCRAAGVRLATNAPAGPAVDAAKNIASPSSTSLSYARSEREGGANEHGRAEAEGRRHSRTLGIVLH